MSKKKFKMVISFLNRSIANSGRVLPYINPQGDQPQQKVALQKRPISLPLVTKDNAGLLSVHSLQGEQPWKVSTQPFWWLYWIFLILISQNIICHSLRVLEYQRRIDFDWRKILRNWTANVSLNVISYNILYVQLV